VELVCESPENDLLILTDGERVKQVLTNLLHNAVKYTERGEIRFGFRVEPPAVRFFVRDTGPGIRKDLLGEVFDRFRKLETEESNKLHRGAGIGLSISKNLVELLGGEIWAASEPGKGSTFSFTLPYHPVPGSQEGKNIPGSGATMISRTRKYRILITEDELTNFLFLKTMLKELDAEIFHAVSGSEAVQLFRDHPDIDLVLMDIRMPGMDGHETTRIIKAIDPRVPIIAQTAMAMEGDREKSLEAGCDDYIRKPIIIEEFRALLAKYLP
jgi:CheY-like chemotaxis protein